MSDIVMALERFRPSVIQAYPSSLYILARWLAAHKRKPSLRLKAILTSSENLYDFQETLFREVFDTQVFDLYGNSERTVMANRCEEGTLHVIPQYGFVELVNRHGQWCEDEGESGEVVSTGFINYAMPFIRYRTADIAGHSAKKCSCGRHYPVLQRIEGRLQEVIVTGENRLISMTAINMHSPVFDNVRQFQFYQDKRGEVVFNVVRKTPYTGQDTEHIKRELARKLGNDMKLEIRFVRQIPRTASGKQRFLIQKLPVGFDS
jgi:phenylacetate-CoA ligase